MPPTPSQTSSSRSYLLPRWLLIITEIAVKLDHDSREKEIKQKKRVYLNRWRERDFQVVVLSMISSDALEKNMFHRYIPTAKA